MQVEAPDQSALTEPMLPTTPASLLMIRRQSLHPRRIPAPRRSLAQEQPHQGRLATLAFLGGIIFGAAVITLVFLFIVHVI